MLTQYKSHSLDRHIATTWRLSPLLDNYVAPVPAQMRHGPRWFAGSADAIYQSLNLISDEHPDEICVFGADQSIAWIHDRWLHSMWRRTSGSPSPRSACRSRGEQLRRDRAGPRRALDRRFPREADDPIGLPDDPGRVLASMGNYVFDADALIDAVVADPKDEHSTHDLGGDIIPALVARGDAQVWDFSDSDVPGAGERDRGYWRDVGTLDAYYDAHMDLVSVDPVFDLYNDAWPILTWNEPLPPAKFVWEEGARTGTARDSLVCAGVIVSGATVQALDSLSEGARSLVCRG